MVLTYTKVSCLSGVQGLVNTYLTPGHCFSKGLPQWERAVMLLCNLHHSEDVTSGYCKCFWKHRRINSGALAGCSISPFLCTARPCLCILNFSSVVAYLESTNFRNKKKDPKCCITCVIKILFYHTRRAALMYNISAQWCCNSAELKWLRKTTTFWITLTCLIHPVWSLSVADRMRQQRGRQK